MSKVLDDPFNIVYEDDGSSILVTQMGIGKVAVSYGHNSDDEMTTLEFAHLIGGPQEGLLPLEAIGQSVHLIAFPTLASLKNFHQKIGDLIDRVSEV